MTQCGPGEMFESLPIIHFLPVIDDQPISEFHAGAITQNSPNVYHCPLYRTRARAGVLSTTGHSSNYVLDLLLPIQDKSDPEEWTLLGVASICEMDTF